MSLLRPLLMSLAGGFALARAAGALIPSVRLASWTPGVGVGVPGGIPAARTHLVDVTQAPYGADPTGATDCHDAILAAINGAQSGDIIYLPPGQYLVAESIAPSQGKSNYTIRGAGDSTRILWNGTTGELLYLGSGSDYQWRYPAGGVAISGGLAQGSTVLIVANTSNVIDGGIIQIAENNDPALPVIHVAGYANARTEKTLVLSHTATTITISPGLYWTLQSGLNPVFNIAQFQSSGIGVENLMIDASAGTAPYNLFLEQCYGCWIYNVHSKNASNYHVFLDDCLQCQVDHCNLDQLNHTGTNGAGLLVNGTSASLFQNNIIYRAFPHIEVNFGSCGNVFAYNFCYDSGVYGAVGASIDSNHGPHNSYNLYEGNIAPNVQCDGYFGSTSEDTIFRNWLHGTAPGIPYAREPILLQRFTRNYSVVGNLLGTAGTPYASISGAPPSAGGPYSFGLPNIGNSGSTGTAQLSLGLPWADWNIVGTLASATGVQGAVSLAAGAGNIAAENASQSIILSIGWAGGGLQTGISSWSLSGGALTFGTGGGAPLPAPGTAVQIWPGPPGYQEKDLDVQATLTLKDNYDIYAGGEPAADQALGSDALPNSLYLSAPPPWFGNLAWPPFNPASPNSAIRSGAQASGYPAGFQAIPAGYRYVNGQDPPGTVLAIASAPAPAPASQTITFAAPNAFTVGIAAVLNASASSGLPVSFSIVSGNAVLSAGNLLTIGDANPVEILASQAGNGSFSAASGVTQTITAVAPPPPAPASQTITFAAPNAFTVGIAAVLNASASSGLPVSFSIVSGNAVLSAGNLLTIGDANPVEILASQAGNGSFSAASGVTQTITAVAPPPPAPASQTITFAAPNAFTVGIAAVLNASASSGLPVSFSIVSGNAVLSAGNLLTIGDANPVEILASQAGNGSFSAASGVTQTITAVAPPPPAPASQTITFAAPNAFTVGIAAVLNASASSGLPVSFSIVSGNAVLSAGNLLTIGDANPVEILASQAGNGSFSAASGVTQTITASAPAPSGGGGTPISTPPAPVLASQTIAFAPAGTVTVGIAAVLGASASSGLAVSFSVVSGNATVSAGNLLTINDTNPVVVLASQAGNGSFHAAATVAQTITASAPVFFGDGVTPIPASPASFPSIQPGSPSVNAGADVTLSVAGAEEGDTYQWLCNGAPIPGATAPSLYLPNIADFQSGSYTVALTDATGAAASASAAVTVNTDAHLVNLSSLVPISAASPVFSAGFVVEGSGPRQILIRSVGPTLGQFGVAGALAAPQLVLFDDSGNIIAANAGWGNPIARGSSPLPLTLQPATAELFAQVGAFALPAGSGDCAIVVTLPPGAYTLEVSGENAATGMALEEVYDTALAATQSQVCNLSARSLVGLGNQILVAGFIVAGTTSDTVLIRGLGPALAQYGVGDVLGSPELILYDNDSNIIATNTGWSHLPLSGPAAVAGEILAATAPLMAGAGAVAMPADSADSALIATLPPGSYSAQVIDAGNATGNAMLEIYELR